MCNKELRKHIMDAGGRGTHMANYPSSLRLPHARDLCISYPTCTPSAREPMRNICQTVNLPYPHTHCNLITGRNLLLPATEKVAMLTWLAKLLTFVSLFMWKQIVLLQRGVLLSAHLYRHSCCASRKNKKGRGKERKEINVTR